MTLDIPFNVTWMRASENPQPNAFIQLRRVSTGFGIYIETDYPAVPGLWTWYPDWTQFADFGEIGSLSELGLLQLSVSNEIGYSKSGLVDSISPKFTLRMASDPISTSTNKDTSTSATTQSLSSTSTAETLPTLTPTAPTSSQDSKETSGGHQFSKGEMAGIGIGASVGGLIFLGLLGEFLYRRCFKAMPLRRREKAKTSGDGLDGATSPSQAEHLIPELAGGGTEKAGALSAFELEHMRSIPRSERETGLNPHSEELDGKGYLGSELENNGPQPKELDSNPPTFRILSPAELDANNFDNDRAPAEVTKSEAGTLLVSPVTSSRSSRVVSGQQHLPYTPPMDIEHGYGYDGTPGST